MRNMVFIPFSYISITIKWREFLKIKIQTLPYLVFFY